MKIGYIGCGIWAFALANLLAKKGHHVLFWCREKEIYESLVKNNEHPRAPGVPSHPLIHPTEDIDEAITDVDVIVEGVTSAGLRPVFASLADRLPKVPIVITSKGIEQKTGLLLSEVMLEALGPNYKPYIGCLSGPSIAPEVLAGHPGSIVASAYEEKIMNQIHEIFSSDFMRVYTNSDIHGVEFGGAMKNIIAIACGVSDGLGYGNNTKAALMTRGLHEMRRLAQYKGCNPETLNGLSGMGDLCLTCMSTLSRNHQMGMHLASGKSFEEAKKIIGMVVEGAYTCVSALELAKEGNVDVPITQCTYDLIYKGRSAEDIVQYLLNRPIKEEMA